MWYFGVPSQYKRNVYETKVPFFMLKSGVNGVPLKSLYCDETKIPFFMLESGVNGVPLKSLYCDETKVPFFMLKSGVGVR